MIYDVGILDGAWKIWGVRFPGVPGCVGVQRATHTKNRPPFRAEQRAHGRGFNSLLELLV